MTSRTSSPAPSFSCRYAEQFGLSDLKLVWTERRGYHLTLPVAQRETVERAGGTVRVRTDAGELRAERLVLATGGVLGGGAAAGGARLLGLERVEVDERGRVRGLSGPLGEARIHACGEVVGLGAEAGLLAVAASALRAGFSAAT